jgi:hypothetical protein
MTVTVGGLVSGNGSLPVSLRLYNGQHAEGYMVGDMLFSRSTPVIESHKLSKPEKGQRIKFLDLPQHSAQYLARTPLFV